MDQNDSDEQPLFIATDIINKIIDDVICRIEDDFNQRKQTKHLLQNVHKQRKPLMKLLTESNIDIHQYEGGFILGRHVKFSNIVQLDVIKQKDNVSCGYYAFHNAYLILKACLSHTYDDLEIHPSKFLKKLKCYPSFLSQQHRMIKLLKQRIHKEGNKSYPWAEKHLQIGICERPYMAHIIETHEESIDLGGSSMFIALPDLCYNSLKNSVLSATTVKQLQTVLDEFQTKENCCRAFIIGTTNHWLSIVANKVTFINKDGILESSTELFYLDSRNLPILNASQEHLKQIIKDYYDDRERRGFVVDARAWRESMYLQSMLDTQIAVELLCDCITGQLHFITKCMDLATDGLLESFESQVVPFRQETIAIVAKSDNNTTSEEQDNPIVNKIHIWLRRVWPPKMLGEFVSKMNELGFEYFSNKSKTDLLLWIDLIKSYNLSESNLCNKSDEEDRILRFLRVVNHLETLFAVPTTTN